MRLLNTTTLELQSFMDDPPHYVILSHTWGEDEVTFDDICKPREQLQQMQGFHKILRSCKIAKQDGFEWIWVDTCCIDKRSSADLSEAINSMYQWYWDAVVCYAYLVDVHREGKSFEDSRWFKRGWTLQELLAPPIVEFYDSSWSMLGTKRSLVREIERATRIDKKYLLDRREISNASIAARFSWASRRETTREEDIAYCLLGLVSVNMPMLYGEKEKAFYRLQLEIVKQSNDHTIFAWQRPCTEVTRSIFASSPGYFQNSSKVYATHREGKEHMTHEVVNSKLRITLPSCARRPFGKVIVARLDCSNENGSIYLELMRSGPDFSCHAYNDVTDLDIDWRSLKEKDLVIDAHYHAALVRVRRDAHSHCMRITATGNDISPSTIVIKENMDGRRWSGIMGETFLLRHGDFAAFPVSFSDAIVGIILDQTILELYSNKRSIDGETSLSRHCNRLRRRVELCTPRGSRKAIASSRALNFADRTALSRSHHFERFWRTEHVALQARKTRFGGELCWTLKVTAWSVDVPYQGQDLQVVRAYVDSVSEDEDEDEDEEEEEEEEEEDKGAGD